MNQKRILCWNIINKSVTWKFKESFMFVFIVQIFNLEYEQ